MLFWNLINQSRTTQQLLKKLHKWHCKGNRQGGPPRVSNPPNIWKLDNQQKTCTCWNSYILVRQRWTVFQWLGYVQRWSHRCPIYIEKDADCKTTPSAHGYRCQPLDVLEHPFGGMSSQLKQFIATCEGSNSFRKIADWCFILSVRVRYQIW